MGVHQAQGRAAAAAGRPSRRTPAGCVRDQASFWKGTWTVDLEGRPVEMQNVSMWKSTHRYLERRPADRRERLDRAAGRPARPWTPTTRCPCTSRCSCSGWNWCISRRNTAAAAGGASAAVDRRGAADAAAGTHPGRRHRAGPRAVEDRRDRRRAPAAQARGWRQPERPLSVPRREVAVIPGDADEKSLPLFRVRGRRRRHLLHPADRPSCPSPRPSNCWPAGPTSSCTTRTTAAAPPAPPTAPTSASGPAWSRPTPPRRPSSPSSWARPTPRPPASSSPSAASTGRWPSTSAAASPPAAGTR